jgi:hypothetical protein
MNCANRRSRCRQGCVPPVGQVLTSAGLEALVGAAWLAVAILTFDRLAERGRASGSIELV